MAAVVNKAYFLSLLDAICSNNKNNNMATRFDSLKVSLLYSVSRKYHLNI